MKKFIFLALILLTGNIFATDISGDVSGTWNLAGSPYNIVGDTNIPIGNVLTIEAGVHIIFQDYYEFRIRGQLLANGADGNEILFTSTDPLVGWQGLYFYQTITNAQPVSVLNFCEMEYGIAVADGGAVRCYYAEVELNNCNIHDNSAPGNGGGIYASFSTLTLNDVIITENYANQSGGIDCHQSNTMTLTDVDITYNDAERTGGMNIDWNSTVTMTNVLIDHNTSHDFGGGLLLGSNSDITFDNVTISYNDADIGYGGGIYINQNVTLNSTNVIINNNSAGYGGGIVCADGSHPNIIGYDIHHNYANWFGGGIYCISGSNPTINNSQIHLNEAGNSGGGIYLYESSPSLLNSFFNENTAGVYGGGIYAYDSNFSLYQSQVNENTASNSGGGIYLNYNSTPTLESSSIMSNKALKGGGIFSASNSNMTFSAIELCDVYSNLAGSGCDFYSSGSSITVYLDHFTVSNPDDYFAHPIENFNFFTINNAIEPQVSADLYVDPLDGNNSNTGLDAANALKTITKALTKIQADELNPHSIHLTGGTYSNGFSEETYPLNCKDYVSFIGINRENVWLNAENSSMVFYLDGDEAVTFEQLTVMNGSATHGGGIYCTDNSDLTLANVYVRDNSAVEGGGGIYAEMGSNLDLSNVAVHNNTSDLFGGGIDCASGATITMNNGEIYSNTGVNGGGLYLSTNNVDLNNLNIYNNVADYGGGVYAEMCMGTTQFTNCNICENTANFDGDGFYIKVELMPFTINMLNCTVCDEVIEFSPYQTRYDYFTATYSNIAGGCEGEGNIDVDPEFIDPENGNFHLLPTSPCIDAGNPDPAYNDPEDPENLGFALYPALGTITADIGSYGGPQADDWTVENPPAVPENVRITITDNGAFIQWDAVDGATSYSVYSSEDPLLSYDSGTWEESVITGTDWTDSNISMEIKKFYFVKAVN